MREAIVNYIRAGYPGVYLVSHEETRAEAELKAAAAATNHGLVAWSATTGLIDTGDGRSLGCEDPMEAVTAITGLSDNTLVLLRDFHMFLQDSNPVLVRALKDALAHAKATASASSSWAAGARCRRNWSANSSPSTSSSPAKPNWARCWTTSANPPSSRRSRATPGIRSWTPPVA